MRDFYELIFSNGEFLLLLRDIKILKNLQYYRKGLPRKLERGMKRGIRHMLCAVHGQISVVEGAGAVASWKFPSS